MKPSPEQMRMVDDLAMKAAMKAVEELDRTIHLMDGIEHGEEISVSIAVKAMGFYRSYVVGFCKCKGITDAQIAEAFAMVDAMALRLGVKSFEGTRR